MNDKVTAVRDVWRYEQGEISKVEDRMVTEFPLTVILNGSEFVTLVCTPEHIEELVIGFLASEGVIRFQKEIKRFTIDESLGFVYVDLVHPETLDQKDYTKRVIGSCHGKGPSFLFSAGCQNSQDGCQPNQDIA